MIKPQDLLCPCPEGLYCPPGDVYIDPVRPVSRAVVTHGHADHAGAGHGAVLMYAQRGRRKRSASVATTPSGSGLAGRVFQVAFEGLQRSARHKSGVAMRFPRISRLRWDKPPAVADELSTLEPMLDQLAQP